MNTISKYHAFCRVIDLGSFTKAAEELGYTQSAVSQIVSSLEKELGTCLVERRRDGIRLTSDGQQYMPFFRNLFGAEQSLAKKQREMDGLERSTILIDTFTSVSRTILPPLMKEFRQQYPGVRFVLRQGDYASIHEDILDDRVDLGFISTGGEAITDIELQKLYDDDMVAVLHPKHPLCQSSSIRLEDLAREDLILLDEGRDYNTVLDGFHRNKLTPSIAYEVYDDYTIISMIRQELGSAILFRRVVDGFSGGVEIRELSQNLTRPVYLAWKNQVTMPIATRRFADYIISRSCE